MNTFKLIICFSLCIGLSSCISSYYVSEDISTNESFVSVENFHKIKPLNYKDKKITATGRITIEVEYNGDLDIIGSCYRKDGEYLFDNNYIRMEKKKNKYTFVVSFQSPGSYEFSVLGLIPEKENSYYQLLQYAIEVIKENPEPILKYRWDEELCSEYGLTLTSFSHKFEEIKNTNGIEKMTFKPNKNITAEGRKLLFVLEERNYYYSDNGMSVNLKNREEAMKHENANYIHTEADKKRIAVEQDNGAYTVALSFPAVDIYTLKVFGVQGKKEKELLLSYTIDAQKSISLNSFVEQYPSALIRDNELCDTLGLSTQSIHPKKPVLHTDGAVTITFTAHKDADIVAEYYVGAPWQYRVAQSVVNGRHEYTVSCPSPGTFYFKINGRLSGEDEYKELFSYTIKASNVIPVETFDKKFANTSNEYSDTFVTVNMKNGNLDLVAYFKKEHSDMGAYYLERMAHYLPALEKYMAHDFISYSDSDEDNNRIALILNENEETAYWMGSIVLAKKHIKTKLPAVIFHECGHFYNPADSIWFFEGTASFFPVAVIEYGLLDKKAGEYDSHFRIWGFTNTNTKDDAPLATNDVRGDSFHFFYMKTFKIQYLIYKELGKENYRKMLHEMYGSAFDFNDPDMDVLKFLEKYKRINWKYFLQGWVFDGDYTQFSHEDFKDNNKNGTIDIEEFYKKNPGGTKVGFGFDK